MSKAVCNLLISYAQYDFRIAFCFIDLLRFLITKICLDCRIIDTAVSMAEVTNMRPAKEFPVAREHFGETSFFKHFFPV